MSVALGSSICPARRSGRTGLFIVTIREEAYIISYQHSTSYVYDILMMVKFMFYMA